ncbi:IS630 family transposase [Streptomyces griseoaurantiacus]
MSIRTFPRSSRPPYGRPSSITPRPARGFPVSSGRGGGGGGQIGRLIFKLYGVRFTEPGVGKYLKRWGLTFQRPDKRAVEQDPEAVRSWHGKTWPTIQARAKADDGEILFAGQVGIRSDQVTGRTWGMKGRTLVVRRTGNRFSVNAMSAISTKGRMHFMVFTESFDATVMCRFLGRIVGHFDRKAHLIVDRHSAHRSKTVRAWLADHQDRIELHFLPSYSPELNPDELVNADLERSLPHTHRARNRTELAAETRRRFFHRRQRQPHVITGYSGQYADCPGWFDFARVVGSRPPGVGLISFFDKWGQWNYVTAASA